MSDKELKDQGESLQHYDH